MIFQYSISIAPPFSGMFTVLQSNHFANIIECVSLMPFGPMDSHQFTPIWLKPKSKPCWIKENLEAQEKT